MGEAGFAARAACGQTRRPRDETVEAARLLSWPRLQVTILQVIPIHPAGERRAERGPRRAFCLIHHARVRARPGEFYAKVFVWPGKYQDESHIRNAQLNEWRATCEACLPRIEPPRRRCSG